MPNQTPAVKTPVLFVGHGSPMNVIESNAVTRALGKLGQDLPRLRAICVVSSALGHSRKPGSDRGVAAHDFAPAAGTIVAAGAAVAFNEIRGKPRW